MERLRIKNWGQEATVLISIKLSSSVIFKTASKCWRWGATFQNFLEAAFCGARGKKSFVSWNFGALELAALRMADSFKILKKSDYERIITSLNAKETQQKERDQKNREIQRLKELRWPFKIKFCNILKIILARAKLANGAILLKVNVKPNSRRKKFDSKKRRKCAAKRTSKRPSIRLGQLRSFSDFEFSNSFRV